jgi:parallel beta-helix repeat protein
MTRKHPTLIALAALLPAAMAGLHAAEVVPHSMAELRQIVTTAIVGKAKRVVIPPGFYRGTPAIGGKVHLAIENVSDLEIVANGVIMICTQPTRAVDIRDCTNVTLRGITVDYDPLPFTQGDIVAVNPGEGWLDVEIHAGYSVEPYCRVDIVDRRTRYRKKDKPYMWDSTAEVRTRSIVRVHNRAAAGFAKAGDLASLGGYGANVIPHAVVVDDSSHITLSNMTVYASNCMGIIATGGEGGHRFLGCRVVPGPLPTGATEARILSTCADAMFTGPMRLGALTEGCEIRDAGDDSWSVQSSDYVILKREGRTLWLASRDSMALRAGDRLQAALDGPLVTVAAREIVPRKSVPLAPSIQQKLVSSGRWGYWRFFNGPEEGMLIKVGCNADVPWQEGDSVYDLDRQGDGFVFRNNTVRSSGRILIKASGLVENNHIEGPFGLSANPEVPYPARAGMATIVIRNNTITDAHLFNPSWHSPQAGAISVTAENGDCNELRPAGIYGKVVIENNTIQGGNGAGIVVSSAREVTIRGNRLVKLLNIPPHDTGGRYRIDNHAAVWFAQCDHVVLRGNELLSPGPEMSQPVVCGPGVKNVEGELTKRESR